MCRHFLFVFLILSIILKQDLVDANKKGRSVSSTPTVVASKRPSSLIPTSFTPTKLPTRQPSLLPTRSPTKSPSTQKPSFSPSTAPTRKPSRGPTTSTPTRSPTSNPTAHPTLKVTALLLTLRVSNPDDRLLNATANSKLLLRGDRRMATWTSGQTIIPAVDTVELYTGLCCTIKFLFSVFKKGSESCWAQASRPPNCAPGSNAKQTCFPLTVNIMVDGSFEDSKALQKTYDGPIAEYLRSNATLFLLADLKPVGNTSIQNQLGSILPVPLSGDVCSQYLDPLETARLHPSPAPTISSVSSTTNQALYSLLLLLIVPIVVIIYWVWKNGRKSGKYVVDGLALHPPDKNCPGSTNNAIQSLSQSFISNYKDSDFHIELSKLKLGKVIGQGANGRIFSARYQGSDVAVKELFSTDAGGEDEEEEHSKKKIITVFMREFESLRKLKHPHVIQLFGLAVAQSIETGAPRFLLVMELADTSLDKILAKKMKGLDPRVPLTPDGPPITPLSDQPFNTLSSTQASISRLLKTEIGNMEQQASVSQITNTINNSIVNDKDNLRWALDIAHQIASGLAFIHDRGVIHFDVKPHNILLDKAGIVKLCDLGISRVSKQENSLNLTSPARAGTPSYMAPELLRSETKLIGTPVDVYAFAILFWQLVHLKVPHPKEWTIAQLFDAVLHKQHRPPIDPLTDALVAKLIEECWQEDPNTRPPLAEVVKELESMLQHEEYLAEEADETFKFTMFHEAVYEVGDYVQVFSSAVGLVNGQVKTVHTGNNLKTYDISLADGALFIEVAAADLLPLMKDYGVSTPSSSISTSEKKSSARMRLLMNPLQELDPKNATVADVATALALVTAGKRKLRKFSMFDRSTTPASSTSNTPKPLSSPSSTRGLIKFGKRMWKSRDSPFTPRQLVLEREDSGSSPDSELFSSSKISKSGRNISSLGKQTSTASSNTSISNLPALTPFSLQFLTETNYGNEQDLAPDLNQTFKYNGNVLELKGLSVSESGVSSRSREDITQTIATTTTNEIPTPDIGSKYKGKLFRVATLGKGASGTVYSALHDETFQIVALKEVKFLTDSAARYQTVRELRALSNLCHPNIVQFYGAFLDSAADRVCIVLEYVLGGSLQDLIYYSAQSNGEKGVVGVINETTLCRIAYDLVSALDYCHSKLIAHLDVKPSNVLLTLNGSAKLADFGLAKTFNEASNVHAATFVGTTKYMSPERLKGENYSFPADIWGLGLSLAAAAKGTFPIDLPTKGGDSAIFFSLLEKLKDQQSLVQLPNHFSSNCKEFIASCLQQNPEERPKAQEALEKFSWFQNIPKEVEKSTTDSKEVAIMVMTEIAEAIAQRAVELDINQNFEGVETLLMINNLKDQLGLDEKDVRFELENASKNYHQRIGLSDALNSQRSQNSDSRRKRELSNSQSSFLSMPAFKSPSMVVGPSSPLSRTEKRSIEDEKVEDEIEAVDEAVNVGNQ